MHRLVEWMGSAVERPMDFLLTGFWAAVASVMSHPPKAVTVLMAMYWLLRIYEVIVSIVRRRSRYRRQ